MIIEFADRRHTGLWNNEITGQLSDGYYENYKRNRQCWWNEAKTTKRNYVSFTNDRVIRPEFPFNLRRMSRQLFSYGLFVRMNAYVNGALLDDSSDNRTAIEQLGAIMYNQYVSQRNDYETAVDNATNAVIELLNDTERQAADSWTRYVVENINELLTVRCLSRFKSTRSKVRAAVQIIWTREDSTDKAIKSKLYQLIDEIQSIVC